MIVKKIILIFALISIAALTSCKSDDIPPIDSNPRTILVYMAACNTLGYYGYDNADLGEMRKAVAAGALQGGRLLVYHTDHQGNAILFELTAQGDVSIKSYGDDGLSSVHGTRMLNVIEDARLAAPSRQFGIVLWSHGLGWLQTGINDPDYPVARAESADAMRPCSWGEEKGSTMNITTLAQVLDRVHPDFVYFDCCYMANVEVAYQLRNSTPWIVGSATELLAEGMPYHLTLPYLFRPDNADLEGAASATFQYISKKTDPEDRTCTMSVIRTAGLAELADAARAVHAASPSLYPTTYTPQAFMVDRVCYFFDLDHYMQALCDAAANGEALRTRWNLALASTVTYADATPYIWNTKPIDHHCGLSTYILYDADQAEVKNYKSLDWPYAAGVLSE